MLFVKHASKGMKFVIPAKLVLDQIGPKESGHQKLTSVHPKVNIL